MCKRFVGYELTWWFTRGWTTYHSFVGIFRRAAKVLVPAYDEWPKRTCALSSAEIKLLLLWGACDISIVPGEFKVVNMHLGEYLEAGLP